MPVSTPEISKASAGATAVAQPRAGVNDVRLAAVVEAAYLLEARTR